MLCQNQLMCIHCPCFQKVTMDLAPSAPPEPAEVEYHWTEVTDDFLSACKGRLDL